MNSVVLSLVTDDPVTQVVFHYPAEAYGRDIVVRNEDIVLDLQYLRARFRSKPFFNTIKHIGIAEYEKGQKPEQAHGTLYSSFEEAIAAYQKGKK